MLRMRHHDRNVRDGGALVENKRKRHVSVARTAVLEGQPREELTARAAQLERECGLGAGRKHDRKARFRYVSDRHRCRHRRRCDTAGTRRFHRNRSRRKAGPGCPEHGENVLPDRGVCGKNDRCRIVGSRQRCAVGSQCRNGDGLLRVRKVVHLNDREVVRALNEERNNR